MCGTVWPSGINANVVVKYHMIHSFIVLGLYPREGL